MSTPVPTRNIPFVNVAAQHAAIRAELLEAMGRVIDSGMYVLGAEVDELERQFAEMCGVRYAVGVNSGTDALIFGLRALGVGSASILAMFLGKAAVIGVLGAACGLALGLLVGTLPNEASLPQVVDPASAAAVLLGAPLLAALASWLPSMAASQQDPAAVLGKE